MKMSKMHIRTLREVPNEAEIPSHILLLRTGMIRKLVSGVYGFMPLGWRSLRKIENIVREEMDATGAQEILMSAVQPAELWQESGRWFAYGPELWRLKDRNGREHNKKRRVLIQTASYESLSDSDEIQRRGETALRPHEKQRVHNEGRLLL